MMLLAAGRTTQERSTLALFAWLAMAVVVWATIFRPVQGDTWRYYLDFLATSRRSFAAVVASADTNLGFHACCGC